MSVPLFRDRGCHTQSPTPARARGPALSRALALPPGIVRALYLSVVIAAKRHNILGAGPGIGATFCHSDTDIDRECGVSSLIADAAF